VLYHAVPFCTNLCYAVSCGTMLYCAWYRMYHAVHTVLCCKILFYAYLAVPLFTMLTMLYHDVLCCTILTMRYCAVPCCILGILYQAFPCFPMLSHALPCFTILYCIVPCLVYCTQLYHAVPCYKLYCSMMCFTMLKAVLHCTVMCFTVT
jgi:hypothetical protein